MASHNNHPTSLASSWDISFLKSLVHQDPKGSNKVAHLFILEVYVSPNRKSVNLSQIYYFLDFSFSCPKMTLITIFTRMTHICLFSHRETLPNFPGCLNSPFPPLLNAPIIQRPPSLSGSAFKEKSRQKSFQPRLA